MGSVTSYQERPHDDRPFDAEHGLNLRPELLSGLIGLEIRTTESRRVVSEERMENAL
jgi:hypothetical protein